MSTTKKYIKGWRLQLLIASIIFLLCSIYLTYIPQSSSWLHREEKLSGNYKIGRIDFWLNGIQDHSIPINIYPNAPTRFYAQGQNRDANFDMAVKLFEIYGTNKGDIDVNVDLSIIDGNTNTHSIYYILVPANTTDTNFTSKKYRDYLDSVFSGYSLTTESERKIAMNAINQASLDSHKGIYIAKDATNQIIYNILVWSEYDYVNMGTPNQYYSISYPITVKATANQINYSSPPQ